jgi:cellulose synthase (UDP-forming)
MKIPKLFRIVLWSGLGLLAIGFSTVVVHHFGTLQWLQWWPRPAIYILGAVVVIVLAMRTWLKRDYAQFFVGLLMLYTGYSYLVHVMTVTAQHLSLIALMHMLGYGGMFVLSVVSFLNQNLPRRTVPAQPAVHVERLPAVAAVIPTYGEPVEVLHDTILALKALDYPQDLLYILVSDDGCRSEVERMARRLGVDYAQGPKRDAKAGNLNKALQIITERFPQASLILTQDADEVLLPAFLKQTVGYFSDPSVAFVQTPKEALAPYGDPFNVRDRIFYDTIQPGRNRSNSAFACGSGVIWRITAIQHIGGFATWNIVEDLTTSFYLHSAGYRSVYHNQVMSIGLSPEDIPGLLKQRGTWAVDTIRLFLFNNPFFCRTLTLRQKLQYSEPALFYLVSALFIPLIMFTPVLSALSGQFVPISGFAMLAYIATSFLYYLVLAQGDSLLVKQMWQGSMAHAPTYFTAFWVALGSRTKKPSYKVTRKTRLDGFFGHLLWMQFVYVVLACVAILRIVFEFPELGLTTRFTNIGSLLFFVVMVWSLCAASFYRVNWFPKPVHVPADATLPSLATRQRAESR